MQPRGKCRLSPKSGDFTEELKERFLSKILSLGRISHHPQAQRVHATAVQSVETFESRRIALLGEPDRFRFRHFPGFCSPRSGHATRRDTSLTAMRRPLQKLHFRYLRGFLSASRPLPTTTPGHPVR